MSRGPLDCCPGEPFHGDPQGLHSWDCPVYTARHDRDTAAERERNLARQREPAVSLEQLVANTELRMVIDHIRFGPAAGEEVRAYQRQLVEELGAGEHRQRRDRRRRPDPTWRLPIVAD